MKQKRFPSLWVIFAVITFFVLLFTAFIIACIAITLFRLGFLAEYTETPLIPISFLLILSVIFGMVLFLFVGRIILQPIKQFSEASKEVAKGNFTIKLQENSKIKEVQDMAYSFNLMVQELSGIETLRTDFVTNVSHEFKTPLAAIEGYATLLQDKDMTDAERDEYAKMIIDSSRQLSTLTENILNLSRLENQEVVLDRKAFRLDEQIREAILLLENRWSEKNIELMVDLAKTSYIGNKNLLRQVWVNLFDNAVKFTPENGCIQIRLFRGENGITVTIADSGRGIEPAQLTHIFDKFYQADKARKETGNGLGLALVKRIVDLCGGEVKVSSQMGQGSGFTVTLPDTVPYSSR